MPTYIPEDLPVHPLPPSPFAQREFVSPAAASSPPPKPPAPGSLAPGLRHAAAILIARAEQDEAAARALRQTAEAKDQAGAVLRGQAVALLREAEAEEVGS